MVPLWHKSTPRMVFRLLIFGVIILSINPLSASSQSINIGVITNPLDPCPHVNNSRKSTQRTYNSFSLGVHTECVEDDLFSVYTKYCHLVNQNISTLIISSFSPNLQNAIDSYSETQFGLPVRRLSTQACDWTLNLASIQSALWENIVKALLALSMKQNWSTVTLLYDTIHEKFKSSLSSQLWRHNNLTLTTINIDFSNQTLFKKYRNIFLHYPVFLVIASDHNVISILQQVRIGNFDLLGQNYEWVIVTDNNDLHHDLQRSKVVMEGDNVAVLSWKRKQNITEMISQTIDDVMESIETINNNGEWQDPALKCGSGRNSGPWATGGILRRELREKETHTCNSTTLEIRTLVVDKKSGVRFDVAGQWNEQKGLTTSNMLYPDKIHGFNNRTFIITTVPYVPFTMKHPNGTWDGICFEILNELARTLNFSYKVVEPPDGKFGILYPDGNFTGMMKQLQDKEVDFAVNIFAIGADREKVADFTMPFMVDPNVILMQKPDLASSKIFICLGPFSNLVWIMIALSVVVVGSILWVITFFHPLSRKPDYEDVGIYDPAINLWQIFGALMQQGMVYIPNFHSSRVIIAAWWFYTIIVVGTYNGNLIAFLTAPKVEMPINTLQDLVSSKMVFGIQRETEFHGNVMNAESGDLQDVWTKITSDPEGRDKYLIDNAVDALQRVFEDKNYAYITEKSFYDTLRVKNVTFAKESCAFSRAKEDISPFLYGFPFQKGSPYVKEFNIGILRILEGGLMQRWTRKWYSGGARCTGLERTTSQKNISLAEAQGAFYILAIGLILALLVLVTEKALSWTSWFKSAEAKFDKKVVQNGHLPQEKNMANGVTSDGSNPVRNPIFGISVEELFGYNTNQEDRGRQRKRDNSFFRSLKNGCCFSVPGSRTTSPEPPSNRRATIRMDDYYGNGMTQNGHTSDQFNRRMSHENGALSAAVVHGLKRWQLDIKNGVKMQADRETGEYL